MNTFTIIGFSTVFVIVIVLIYCLFSSILDKIKEVLYMHKYKHRFDKKPIAKCYCKDCRRRFKIGTCNEMGGLYVADDFFCKSAEPHKHDPEDNKQFKEGDV